MPRFQSEPDSEFWGPGPQARKSGSSWGWILAGIGLSVVLVVTLCCGGAAYIGLQGPNTSVYLGTQVPARFSATMQEVGAIQPGEQIEYFYSDAVLDIRDGFYFVSDQGVVLYNQSWTTPLVRIPFAEIAAVAMEDSDDEWTDSQIAIVLLDGTEHAFPVSTEMDRDQKFLDAIEQGRADAAKIDQ